MVRVAVSFVMIIAAAGAVRIRQADAGMPFPPTSHVESPMVGSASGALLSGIGSAGYQVQDLDINNTPISGYIILDFSAAPGIKLYASQEARSEERRVGTGWREPGGRG